MYRKQLSLQIKKAETSYKAFTTKANNSLESYFILPYIAIWEKNTKSNLSVLLKIINRYTIFNIITAHAPINIQ